MEKADKGYTITGDKLVGLDVRTCMLLADDDPVIPINGLDDLHAPEWLSIIRSRYGGHCGFLSGPRLVSWLDTFILGQLEVA